MRLLVHGMQSSGATSFTRMLAERPGCVALIDILNNYAAPRIHSQVDFVAKAVITTAYPLSVHRERFRPDKIVLLLRDPRDNYASLQSKPYRNHSGLIDEKFALLDEIFNARSLFDAVIHYEDFLSRDPGMFGALERLGWPVSEDYYRYTRTPNDLIGALWRHEPHLIDSLELAFGNSRGREVTSAWRTRSHDAGIEARLAELCPALLSHYRARAGA